jgi:hypothetical protein
MPIHTVVPVIIFFTEVCTYSIYILTGLCISLLLLREIRVWEVALSYLYKKAGLRIRIRKDLHHFTGSGISDADPDPNPRLQN